MSWESAIEHYLNTDTPEARTRISSCYLQMGASEFKRGNLGKAIQHYRNTIEVDEMIINIANSYYQMDEVELEKKNWCGAIELYQMSNFKDYARKISLCENMIESERQEHQRT